MMNKRDLYKTMTQKGYEEGFEDALRIKVNPKWGKEDGYQYAVEQHGKLGGQIWMLRQAAEAVHAPITVGFDTKDLKHAARFIAMWKKLPTDQRKAYNSMVIYSPNKFVETEITNLSGQRVRLWTMWDYFAGLVVKPAKRGKEQHTLIKDTIALMDWLKQAKASPA